MARKNANRDTPSGQLQRLIMGYRLTYAIGVIAQLGIADLLAYGPMSTEDMASATGSNADALYRVLRLLASEGLFQEVAHEQFALTDLARPLIDNGPGSMRPRAIIEATEWAAAWADLKHCVSTGQPSFERVFGAPPFDHYARNPHASALFDAAMTSMTAQVTDALVDAYDFGTARVVVDVGGGRGTLLAAILGANQAVRGVLFDRAWVLAGAPPVLTSAGVHERCSIVAGDFFVNVPSGADCYLMKFILDDWSDADAHRILANCRIAMAPGGRVLIIEMPIPDGNAPCYGKWTDVNMLVMLGGRERSLADYRTLLARAGLRLNRVIQTNSVFSVLETVAT